MNRALVREVAMKLLYSRCIGGEGNTQDIMEQSDCSAEFTDPEKTFLDNLVFGVGEHMADLDSLITQYSKGWSIDRLARVDLCILRMGVYELMYEPSIPVGATINEAVELAKRFGDVKSYGFINGILSSVAKSISK